MAFEHLALRHHRHKKASLSISSCFTFHHFQDFESLHSSPGSLSPNFHTPPHHYRMSKVKTRLHHHRRHTSDLSYDAVSYAHNFEDARSTVGEATEEVRSFISRLPISPRPGRRDEVDVTTGKVVHSPVGVGQQTIEVLV
ncbi:hypothetical protein POM88_020635 [Heracleum sosnowskyi]|uniref:Uncharacterized protein n=1 Tax=Heracleum sosnowskyi TaxID=360622 RepID=A0AAD8IFG0_9APIA|nr:hypothetical protein POM88_020635 [Heracleum sosnowskyi]